MLNFRSKFAKLSTAIKYYNVFSVLLVNVRESFLVESRWVKLIRTCGLLVSSELFTPFFPLIGNEEFFTCHLEFIVKMSAKNR